MSWIADIAGKAENFLNKIDQNAAAVLKKDQNAKKGTNSSSSAAPSETSVSGRSSPMMVIRNSRIDDIMTEPSVPLTISSHYPDLLDSVSSEEKKELSDLFVQPIPPPSNITEDIRVLTCENEMLKNEIRSLNGEVSHLLDRMKQSQEGSSGMEESLLQYRNEIENLRIQLNDTTRKYEDAQQQCIFLNDINKRLEGSAIHRNETEISDLQVELSNFQNKLEATERKAALLEKELVAAGERESETRNELTCYRQKAQKSLAEKLKIIEELSKRMPSPQESVSAPAPHQEELMPMFANDSDGCTDCEKLRMEMAVLKSDFSEKIEACRQEAEDALECEIAKRSALKDELVSMRKEMLQTASRLAEKESELKRLELINKQSTTNNKIIANGESMRVNNLTSALVRKQAALERVTADCAQLRLQLERAKKQYRGYRLDMRTNYLNDTDDVKARSEVVSGTSVIVSSAFKRTLAGLDSLVGRSTAFVVRACPMARTIALFYLLVLHLLICLVLYSWMPDTK